MNCNRIQSLLSAYSDGELSGREMRTVRDHVSQCPNCNRELEGYRAIKSIVGRSHLIETPQGFEDRLKQQVFAPVVPPARLSAKWALACALFGATAAVLLSRDATSRPIASNQPVPNQIARDQAYAVGGDGIGGQFPIITVTHDLK